MSRYILYLKVSDFLWTNFFPDEPLIRSLDMDMKNWLVDETYILDNIKRGACVAALDDKAHLSLNHDSDKVRAHDVSGSDMCRSNRDTGPPAWKGTSRLRAPVVHRFLF